MSLPPMRIIVAGSRGFNDFKLLERKCNRLIGHAQDIVILSGTARGADQLGEKYAEKYDYEIKRYPADWDLHGRRAGYIRNQQMAGDATHLIAFWDGHSPGTKMMIDIARDHRLKIKVIRYGS